MLVLLCVLAQDPTLIPPAREVGVFPHYAEAPLEPRACAFGKDGRLYVADAGAHKILIFGADGKPAGAWGGPDELLEPSGVAVGLEGVVYVAERGRGRVRLFDPDGRFLYEWKGLSAPRHVAVYGDRVYVSESEHGRVRVFGGRGEPGPVIEGLDRPGAAAADEAGRIYVPESGQHRIRVFRPDGSPLTAWGSWGAPPGFFSRPSAAAWAGGRLVVVEAGNHRAQVFDGEGKLLRLWGAPPIRPGQGAGHLHGPAHVALSPDGAWAAIAEPLERRVQVFPYRDPPERAPWYGVAWWEKMHAKPATPDPSAPKTPAFAVLVALAERDSHSVFFVDVTENTVSRVVARAGGFGARLGLFNDPVSVAFDAAARRAWVSDAGNRRVQLLALDDGGRVRALAAWAVAGTPGPLALDGRGRLLLLDAAGSALDIYATKDMARVATLRAPDGARWEAVAASAERIALVDGLGCRVQLFDAAGAPAATWGSRADFLRPAGVAIDGEGRIHVVDALQKEGKTFDASGRLLKRWAGPGVGPTKLHGPVSMSFGRPDHLLVDDAGAHMGQVFRLDGRSAGFFLKAGIPAGGGR